MMIRGLLLACSGLLVLPAYAFAATEPLTLPVWTVAPFMLLLLAIALLPLFAGHFWHSNLNRALLTSLIALPTVAYLYFHEVQTGEHAMAVLAHEMTNYVSFILLLGALYTVSGGIVLQGDILPRPIVNTTFLLFGCALANVIGTTGASMLLIRPLLRINRHRKHIAHLPVFFIFLVSNLGGLLTPLGDPPLFLGFLNGVPFFWTFQLWQPWLVAVGIVTLMFFLWDSIAYAREDVEARSAKLLGNDVLRLLGSFNFLMLGGVVAAVMIQGQFEGSTGPLVGGAMMLGMAVLSWLFTPSSLRLANGFSWAPIIEVAVLFAGIFATMVPALQILSARRDEFGIDQAWQYFWLTGGLSSFLDNAPTYMTFATMAAGSSDFAALAENSVPGMDGPLILSAISCGAVFMGANTYIGNGPNFMVKAIADEAGYRTPSFFGYMLYSAFILLPVFALITWLFFRP